MEVIEYAPLPGIEIYCGKQQESATAAAEIRKETLSASVEYKIENLAEAVGYGIEEEGLPYRLIAKGLSRQEAFDLTKGAGLGVVILVEGENVSVFTRQLKQQKPLFEIKVKDIENAKTIGKNAARIVKNKPFLEME